MSFFLYADYIFANHAESDHSGALLKAHLKGFQEVNKGHSSFGECPCVLFFSMDSADWLAAYIPYQEKR